MGCYFTLCHNTYGYSLLFYKVYHEEGECRQLGFWAGKGANIRDPFYTTPKVLKLHESQFWNILKILGKESTRGGPPTVHEGGGCALPPWARPLPRGPPGSPPVPIFCYMKSFVREKNHKQAFGMRLRRHEVEPWRNQSRALAELFCRGNFPPGGGNHRHRHHQRSSHREGVNLHQHLHQHHLLSNPSSSLVSNSCI